MGSRPEWIKLIAVCFDMCKAAHSSVELSCGGRVDSKAVSQYMVTPPSLSALLQ